MENVQVLTRELLFYSTRMQVSLRALCVLYDSLNLGVIMLDDMVEGSQVRGSFSLQTRAGRENVWKVAYAAVDPDIQVLSEYSEEKYPPVPV